ncbi:MAG: PQQ-like beta-propeller repeat protein [Deltaproteobacteria bacterium]|nr:PQQ-like beta-propeller repeat protein [Deltaproteobacteria bacterium]
MTTHRTATLTTTMVLAVSACAPLDDDAALGETELSLVAPAFVVAAQGCAMAHCDPQMSDQVGLPAPAAPAITRWHDAGGRFRAEPAGSAIGLGCSSNGRVAACTYGGFGDNLVVYRANGTIVYRKRELGAFAWASGAMIDEQGGVLTADSSYLYRYGPWGVRYWRTPTPGGYPISPVQTDNGVVVLATREGPLSAYRTTDGKKLDELDLGFDTENTPGVSGNRIYVSTAQGTTQAKLAAVDVSPTVGAALVDGWGSGAYVYEPSSGASPAVRDGRIFFDGHLGGVPHVFCVRDDGSHATELWKRPMKSNVTASPALDPRGGVWTYAVNNPELYRLRESDGTELDTIDLDALVGGLATYSPSSVMSLAGSPEEPVMIVAARANGTLKTYVVAIELTTLSLRWKVLVEPVWDSTAAQFAIALDGQHKPVVVFPTFGGGARGIGSL